MTLLVRRLAPFAVLALVGSSAAFAMEEPAALKGAAQLFAAGNYDAGLIELSGLAGDLRDQPALYVLLAQGWWGKADAALDAKDRAGTVAALQRARSHAAVAESLAAPADKPAVRALLKQADDTLALLGGAAPAKPAAPAPAPAPAKPAVAATRPKPNWIQGRATTVDGRPLADAEIAIHGTSLANGSNVSLYPHTGADGRYALEVPPGGYSVSATAKRTLGDHVYQVRLYPVGGREVATQDSRPGIAQDYQLKVSGLIPGREGSRENGFAWYGASLRASFYVTVGMDTWYKEANDKRRALCPKGSNVRLTLTPTSPLLDGTTGRPVTLEKVYDGGDTWSGEFHDVPVATYTVTAEVIRPDGTRMALKGKQEYKQQPAAESFTLVWDSEGTPSGARPTHLELAF